MAYNNTKPAYGTTAPRSTGTTAAAPVSGTKEFVDDPSEVGIGYGKKAVKTGEEYVSITVTKEIPAGTKLALFLNNKVKNRTERTPTHKLKISKPKVV